MNHLCNIFLLTIMVGCSNKSTSPPIWLNRTSDAILSTDTFKFMTVGKNWRATLYTFTQPIPLQITYHKDTLLLSKKNDIGIIEGPATIYLECDHEQFTYPIYLINKQSSAAITKDYRSSKTVNCDSSLIQQSIKHKIDRHRNIIADSNKKYFKEEKYKLVPKTKTYRAIADQAITAYYVQPGSGTSIRLSSKYNIETKQYELTTELIYDTYKNIIADGTQVSFEFSNAYDKGQVQVFTSNGRAKATLPPMLKGHYKVVAKINELKSEVIDLNI